MSQHRQVAPSSGAKGGAVAQKTVTFSTKDRVALPKCKTCDGKSGHETGVCGKCRGVPTALSRKAGGARPTALSRKAGGARPVAGGAGVGAGVVHPNPQGILGASSASGCPCALSGWAGGEGKAACLAAGKGDRREQTRWAPACLRKEDRPRLPAVGKGRQGCEKKIGFVSRRWARGDKRGPAPWRRRLLLFNIKKRFFGPFPKSNRDLVSRLL